MSNQKTVVNYILVYMLLFVSGSWRYNLSPDKFLVLSFVFAVVCWIIFSDRKVNDRFVLYVSLFTGYLLILSVYTGGSLSLPSTISLTMKLVLAYLILKTVGETFPDTFVKVVIFLAAFSLFGYLTDTFHLFDTVITKLPAVGDHGYEGIFYVYRFPWHISRNNSIFYEPGAYQVFLNAALFILFFAKTDFSVRKRWLYIILLLITLLTTFSTAGYVIFAAIFGLFLATSRIMSATGKVVLVILISAMITILAAQFQSVISVKVGEYLAQDDNDIRTSALKRSFDAKVDMELFKKHVFGVGHKKYEEEFRTIGGISEEKPSSSNGVTKMLAVFGLPFSLFIFGSYYWALLKLHDDFLIGTVAFGLVLTFLISQSYYAASPLCLAIIAAAFVFDRSQMNEGVERETEVVR